MQLETFRELIVNMPVTYQSFTSQRKTWEKTINKRNEASEALVRIFGNASSVTISRRDLFDLAQEDDWARFAMATLVWGYPAGMRGNNISDIADHLPKLKPLLREAYENPIGDWRAHYAQVKLVRGMGLSTYTKYLYFLSTSVEGYPAIILDDRIIRVANQGVFTDLLTIRDLNTHNAINLYPGYLACIHEIADRIQRSAENIEFFLFAFGLNLKPPAGNKHICSQPR